MVVCRTSYACSGRGAFFCFVAFVVKSATVLVWDAVWGVHRAVVATTFFGTLFCKGCKGYP